MTHGQKSAKAYYLNKMAEHKNNRYENSYILKDMILNFKKKKKEKKNELVTLGVASTLIQNPLK